MPETMLPWLSEAQIAVDRAGAEKDSQNRFEMLTQLDTTLDELYALTQAVATAAKVMRGRGWAPVSVQGRILSGLEALTRNPLSRNRNATTRDAAVYLATLEKDLQRAWTVLVVESLGRVGGLLDLVQVLSAVPSLTDVASRIDDAASELQRSRKALPTERLLAVLEQIPVLQQELRCQVPQSVIDFLLAVARGEAGLEMLTTEVIDWLNVNGISSQFRVVAQKRGTQRG